MEIKVDDFEGNDQEFDKLEIVEAFVIDNEDFKKNVVIPYFKDIYKDLVQRSDDKNKGINRIAMMEYANLPGILFDRFFAIVDTQGTGYADIRSFLVALCKIYYSNIEAKIKFAFDIYDFDKDGFIHKEDVRIVMSFLPIHQI
jgi:hypothetical protein